MCAREKLVLVGDVGVVPYGWAARGGRGDARTRLAVTAAARGLRFG